MLADLGEIADRQRIISTWYYEQTQEEALLHPQVHGNSSGERFRDTYRRCIAVFFASARRADRAARLILFLNSPWRSSASRVARQVFGFLEQLGVELVVLPYTFAPVRTWPPTWRNQFFVFDVMNWIAHSSDAGTLSLVLDSDIVWTGNDSTVQMWRSIARQGCVALDIGYDEVAPINSLSRRDLTQVARAFGLPTDATLVYYGGEFIAVRRDICCALSTTAAEIWPLVIDRFEQSLPTFIEEAHFLSYLYPAIGCSPASADHFVRRLWTQPFREQNTQPTDADLALWHVPAEKQFGLRRVYGDIAQGGLDDWLELPQQSFLLQVGQQVGVPRNPATKVVRDVARAIARRATSARPKRRVR